MTCKSGYSIQLDTIQSRRLLLHKKMYVIQSKVKNSYESAGARRMILDCIGEYTASMLYLHQRMEHAYFSL